MAHASSRELDLRTATPFGISRGTHSEFADYAVELRAGEHVGRASSTLIAEQAGNRTSSWAFRQAPVARSLAT